MDAASAQDSYRVLMRDFVGPALRANGYKGSSGRYKRKSSDYFVSISFVKDRRSSKDCIYYLLRTSVVHPETNELYNNANREARGQGRESEQAPAGSWFRDYPGAFFRGFPWIDLRQEEEVSSHADELLRNLNRYLFPEFERQLRLPLSIPTPPSQRPVEQSKHQRDEDLLFGILRVLPSIESPLGTQNEPMI